MIAEILDLHDGGKPIRPDTKVYIHDADFPMLSTTDCKHFPNYLKITFVRNPWERLVSCYEDKIVKREKKSGDIHTGLSRYNEIFRMNIFHKGMSFERFVNMVSIIPDALSDEHFRSQHKMFGLKNGQPFCEFIGRIETFTDDFKRLSNRLNLPKINLQYANQSSNKDYQQHYTSSLAKKVARRYRKDIELLKYSF